MTTIMTTRCDAPGCRRASDVHGEIPIALSVTGDGVGVYKNACSDAHLAIVFRQLASESDERAAGRKATEQKEPHRNGVRHA